MSAHRQGATVGRTARSASPVNQTGHPAWGDPVNHPWTTGLGLAYTSEGGLWGKFIESHASEFPNGITVAGLILNNDGGRISDAGFKSWLDSSPIKDKVQYVTDLVDPQAPTTTNQMTTLVQEARRVSGHGGRHVLHPGSAGGGQG